MCSIYFHRSLAHEQFLLHPSVHPHDTASAICCRLCQCHWDKLVIIQNPPIFFIRWGDGLVDISTLIYHSLKRRRKASSVGGSRFSSVDFLFRNLYTPGLSEIGGFEFVSSVGVHGYDKLPCLVDNIWCDVILVLIGEVLQCRYVRCLAENSATPSYQ